MSETIRDQLDRDPAELLKMLRGQGRVCACGKILEPFEFEGRKMLIHASVEDESHHVFFFTGEYYQDEEGNDIK